MRTIRPFLFLIAIAVLIAACGGSTAASAPAAQAAGETIGRAARVSAAEPTAPRPRTQNRHPVSVAARSLPSTTPRSSAPAR